MVNRGTSSTWGGTNSPETMTSCMAVPPLGLNLARAYPMRVPPAMETTTAGMATWNELIR